MKHNYSLVFLLTSVLLSLAAGGCKAANPTPGVGTPYPVVRVPRSEIRQLHSSETGRDYDLYIRLPDEYEKYPKVKYPVLYLLDAQWDFKMMDSIYGSLKYDGFIPEMIIVGITYSGDKPDYETLRAKDFTPVNTNNVPGSGDAPKFLAFLKDTVIPFVESNYQTRPSERVLMGHSYGGLFTLYAMFTEPSLFSGYVSGSPVTVYDTNFSFKQEEAYFEQNKELPTRLYIFVGGEESLLYPVTQFVDVLQSRNYEGLKLETRVIEGEGHSSSKTEGYNRGLRFVFQD
jgi:predicted alpha/beta superfamily hydrolase